MSEQKCSCRYDDCEIVHGGCPQCLRDEAAHQAAEKARKQVAK